jgi:hypothetical protein
MQTLIEDKRNTHYLTYVNPEIEKEKSFKSGQELRREKRKLAKRK